MKRRPPEMERGKRSQQIADQIFPGGTVSVSTRNGFRERGFLVV